MKKDTETVPERFAALIEDLGISKNAFAKSLGKTATVIQHLIDGRNKPGFDLLEIIFTVYPNVSKDWMLMGEGPRYITAENSAPTADEPDATKVSSEETSAVEEAAAPAPASVPPVASPEPVPTPAPIAEATPQPSAVAPISQAPAPTAATDTGWQSALYTQQMAHQLAMAELRNQHLQEQQRLMQQMMDMMQRQLSA